MIRHGLLIAALIVFVLAAIWPALPDSAQPIRLNLTALGLALFTAAELVPGPG